VEATPIRVGSLKEFPSEETAWRRVEELRLNPNQSTFGISPQATFGQLAAHYMQHELPENQDNATIERAYSTILKYRRYLKRWALPRWEEDAGTHRRADRSRALAQGDQERTWP
jgi:hypothetical protein